MDEKACRFQILNREVFPVLGETQTNSKVSDLLFEKSGFSISEGSLSCPF